MKLYELFTAEELQAQIDAAMVKRTPDPTGQLAILNYTKRAQYTPELWNRVTDQCRGLIVDNHDNIVARPFEKFWNLDDPRYPETLTANLPSSTPLIARKMDGSLGIGYRLDGSWRVATRGSFTSDQSGPPMGCQRTRPTAGRHSSRSSTPKTRSSCATTNRAWCC